MAESRQYNNPSWYLAATKPKEEKRAQENLKTQHIESFLPLVDVDKIRSGKKVRLQEVLFPSYIFIHIDPLNPTFSKIRSTRGIRDWVRFNGKPATISDSLIQDIEILSKKQANFSEVPKQGSKVRIKRGPFAELEAVYQSADGLERSIILLDILGKQQTIFIENKNLITR